MVFLNGELEEEVYMIQPEKFTCIDESKVCKLQRFIYGLKQASQSWKMHFDKTIKMYDFVKNREEPCIYKWTNSSVVIFFVLYVDDILLIGHDIPILQSMKL